MTIQDDSQERTEQYEKYGKGEKHMKKYICRLAVILTLALLVCLLWSSIFVTLVPNNFVFHTGLQMVSDNHCKNVVLHGCTKYTQILILLDSVHHHYGSNVNL